jgi:hypothetical protein
MSGEDQDISEDRKILASGVSYPDRTSKILTSFNIL